MPKKIFTLIILCAGLSLSAQTIKVDDNILRGEFTINGGLNTDGYQIDAGLAYFPGDCFGLKFSIGMNAEIEAFDDCDCWSSYEKYAIRFRFTPAFVFRTPRLIKFRETNSGLNLFAEPGFTFSPGSSGSKDARTCCWDFKCGINLQFGIGFFAIGYEVTNFSLYSGRPVSAYAQPDDVNRNTQAGFIGLGFKF